MHVRKFAAFSLIGLTTGCSAFVPKQQAIMIDTTPHGIPVYVDGEDRGRSPITVKLDRNKSHSILAATQGSVYRTEINPKLSAAGTLDIFGAAVVLVPGIGLLTPGAYDLDMKTVMLHLDEAPASTTQPATMPAK